MSGMSDYYKNKLQDHVFRATAFSAPASVFVALFTAAPTDAGGGTEMTGGSYARVEITAALASWLGTHGSATGVSSGTNGTISNAADVVFPAPTADWGTAIHWALYDASTSGNLIVHAALTANKLIENGDAAPTFEIGSLTNQIDN